MYCLGSEGIKHATGIPIEWTDKHNNGHFGRRYLTAKGTSHSEIEYLVWQSKLHESEGKLNHYYFGGQHSILGRKFRYDGVIHETKKLFEFYG